MHRHWIAVAALIVLITGCNSGAAQNADPTATLYVIPTLSPTEMLTQPAAAASPTLAEAASPDALDVQKLDVSTLDSYGSTFEMSWSGTDENGQAIEGIYNVLTLINKPAESRYVQWSSSATTVPNASFELIEIGGEAWMIIGDDTDSMCLSGSVEELGAQDAPYSPDYWFAGGDLSGLQRVLPDEEIDGIPVQRYQLTQTDLASFAGYSDYTLDLWIDAQTGYLVRQALIADGTFTDFATGSGHVEWTYDLFDVNAPVEITAPETCEDPAS